MAVSQNQIAKLTGFSRSTVSRALANHPLISAQTKKEVRAAAKKLGYQTNPLVSTLTAQIRKSRISPTVSTLGYITSFPLNLDEHNHWTEFYHGAREQAAELGYGLDVIWRRQPGMTTAKFNGILRAPGSHHHPAPRCHGSRHHGFFAAGGGDGGLPALETAHSPLFGLAFAVHEPCPEKNHETRL
jgi:transcriptional regulator with XRE-family HTH domain